MTGRLYISQFELDLKPTDFEDLDRDAAARLLTERLKSLYAEKERSYPVEFAIEEYLTPQVGIGNQDFEGLAAWASQVYLTEVKPETIRHRDPRVVHDRLLAAAHTT